MKERRQAGTHERPVEPGAPALARRVPRVAGPVPVEVVEVVRLPRIRREDDRDPRPRRRRRAHDERRLRERLAHAEPRDVDARRPRTDADSRHSAVDGARARHGDARRRVDDSVQGVEAKPRRRCGGSRPLPAAGSPPRTGPACPARGSPGPSARSSPHSVSHGEPCDVRPSRDGAAGAAQRTVVGPPPPGRERGARARAAVCAARRRTRRTRHGRA